MDELGGYAQSAYSGSAVRDLSSVHLSGCNGQEVCIPIKIYSKLRDPVTNVDSEVRGGHSERPLNKRKAYILISEKINFSGDPNIQVYKALARELGRVNYIEVIKEVSRFWGNNPNPFKGEEKYHEQKLYMENLRGLIEDEASCPEFDPEAIFPIISSAFNISIEYTCGGIRTKYISCLPDYSKAQDSLKLIRYPNNPDWFMWKTYHQRARHFIDHRPDQDLKTSDRADDRFLRSLKEAELLSSGALQLGHEGMRGYLARWDGEVSASPETLKYLGFELCPTAPFGNCFYEASAGQIHGENAVSLRVLMHKAALRLIESPTRAMNNDLLIFDREWLQNQVEGKYIIRHVPYNPDRTESSLAFWATLQHVPLLAYAVRRTVIVYGYQQCDHYASVASLGYGLDGNNRDLEDISPKEDVIYLVCKDVGEGGHYDGLRRIKNEKEEVS
ncbi:hypothetical protein GV64_23915 [Endozoicomonas elysicola]|uniref:Uncharacterized protein n=2 Tax=Endozoicomonas elysicola TaxID=305900 RepID=A0A081KGT4_9GAMM|nr:hypothetical protein GV64_23915 [Endozoicomonas elysicola]